jgi:hypothetical protein
MYTSWMPAPDWAEKRYTTDVEKSLSALEAANRAKQVATGKWTPVQELQGLKESKRVCVRARSWKGEA